MTLYADSWLVNYFDCHLFLNTRKFTDYSRIISLCGRHFRHFKIIHYGLATMLASSHIMIFIRSWHRLPKLYQSENKRTDYPSLPDFNSFKFRCHIFINLHNFLHTTLCNLLISQSDGADIKWSQRGRHPPCEVTRWRKMTPSGCHLQSSVLLLCQLLPGKKKTHICPKWLIDFIRLPAKPLRRSSAATSCRSRGRGTPSSWREKKRGTWAEAWKPFNDSQSPNAARKSNFTWP